MHMYLSESFCKVYMTNIPISQMRKLRPEMDNKIPNCHCPCQTYPHGTNYTSSVFGVTCGCSHRDITGKAPRSLVTLQAQNEQIAQQGALGRRMQPLEEAVGAGTVLTISLWAWKKVKPGFRSSGIGSPDLPTEDCQ